MPDGMNNGLSPSGKAPDFDSGIAGSTPAAPAKYDSLAQSVEHLTFNQVVGGSNPPCLIIDKRYRKYDTFYFFAFLMNSASGNRTSFL